MDYRSLLIALLLIAAIVGHASGEGRSVDDMVGIFSIEKTIKLGSSSACFGNAAENAEAKRDPLGIASDPLADSQPPDLAGFGFEPKVLTGAFRSIDLKAHIIDDESGLKNAKAFFNSPSGGQTAEAAFTTSGRISGTPKDGIYATKIILQEDCEKGAWLLDNLTLLDPSGNQKVLSRSDLVSMNLPAEFVVS